MMATVTSRSVTPVEQTFEILLNLDGGIGCSLGNLAFPPAFSTTGPTFNVHLAPHLSIVHTTMSIQAPRVRI